MRRVTKKENDVLAMRKEVLPDTDDIVYIPVTSVDELINVPVRDLVFLPHKQSGEISDFEDVLKAKYPASHPELTRVKRNWGLSRYSFIVKPVGSDICEHSDPYKLVAIAKNLGYVAVDRVYSDAQLVEHGCYAGTRNGKPAVIYNPKIAKKREEKMREQQRKVASNAGKNCYLYDVYATIVSFRHEITKETTLWFSIRPPKSWKEAGECLLQGVIVYDAVFGPGAYLTNDKFRLFVHKYKNDPEAQRKLMRSKSKNIDRINYWLTSVNTRYARRPKGNKQHWSLPILISQQNK